MQLIEEIREHHRHDRFAIKQQQRVDRALEAHIVFNVVSLPHDASETERKAAWSKAKEMIGKAKPLTLDGQREHASPIAALVQATDAARAPWDAIRKTHEKAMVRLVKRLPIATWAKTVRGLGELSLARIIGEAGSLANYRDKSKLWKRMGLAVMDGKRQGSPGQGASDDEWIAHGYNAERRSVMFVIGENLIRLRSEPYYPIYLTRKAYELERGCSKAHAHNRAKRYIEKRLLADLWRAWRRTDQPCREGEIEASLSSVASQNEGEAIGSSQERRQKAGADKANVSMLVLAALELPSPHLIGAHHGE